uniref:Retrovirus-related Pol polyprotein from transposon TNT 1-94 n=1 Tax=Cajanus cajan TaxID=3821 RepID=A0A151S1U9_CAJCA|nr:hypothetical protein KK1_029542 [Cajanus cajan]
MSNNPIIVQMKIHKIKKKSRRQRKTCLFACVSQDVFTRIMALKLLKSNKYVGDERIQTIQVLNLIREFELQRMKETRTIKQYSKKMFGIAKKVQLLGTQFPNSIIIEKFSITALENTKDVSKITLAEVLHALQALEQRKYMRREIFVEGVYLVKWKNKNGDKNKKSKRDFGRGQLQNVTSVGNNDTWKNYSHLISNNKKSTLLKIYKKRKKNKYSQCHAEGILHDLNFSDFDKYFDFIKGKFNVEARKSKVTRSEKVLQLINIDICGPLFLLLWVFLGILLTLLIYQGMEINMKIMCVTSDRGGEFYERFDKTKRNLGLFARFLQDKKCFKITTYILNHVPSKFVAKTLYNLMLSIRPSLPTSSHLSKKKSGRKFIILILYIDDSLLACNDISFLFEKIPYASIVGSLMLGRYLIDRGVSQIRYIQGTKQHFLIYKRFDHLEVINYTNADYDGCLDDHDIYDYVLTIFEYFSANVMVNGSIIICKHYIYDKNVDPHCYETFMILFSFLEFAS